MSQFLCQHFDGKKADFVPDQNRLQRFFERFVQKGTIPFPSAFGSFLRLCVEVVSCQQLYFIKTRVSKVTFLPFIFTSQQCDQKKSPNVYKVAQKWVH